MPIKKNEPSPKTSKSTPDPNPTIGDVPFEIKNFLEALNDSSSRSRSIFLVMIFSSLLILMALVNSLKPEYNWYKSRSEVIKTAARYLIFPTDPIDTIYHQNGLFLICRPFDRFEDFIINNERLIYKKKNLSKTEMDSVKQISAHSRLKNDMLLYNPMFEPVEDSTFQARYKKYVEISNAIEMVNTHNYINKGNMLSYINKLDELEAEHMRLVRVPILGISFEVNFLGAYGGFTLLILYMLQYYSFVREHRNLKILFKRAWLNGQYHHFHYYEYFTTHQVLTVPRKLFEPQRKQESLIRWLPTLAFMFPLAVFISLVGYDLSTIDIGQQLNKKLTLTTLFLDIALLLMILFAAIKVWHRLIRIDKLWDSQAHEFNLEYILECIGIDKDIDLVKGYVKPVLNKNQVDEVKNTWYWMVVNRFRKTTKVSEKQALGLLDNFIQACLGNKFNRTNDYLNKSKEIDIAWDALTKWFESHGRRNVSHNFRSSFNDMLVKLRKDLA
jgi:hypothetical protein